MELFRTSKFYILRNDHYSLWCDRQTGKLIPRTALDIVEAENPVCLGRCDGLIGKIKHIPVFEPRLLLIKHSVPVGRLHGNNIVYKIKSIVILPLSLEDVQVDLHECSKHAPILSFNKQPNTIFDLQKSSALFKTWGTLKSAGNTIKNTTQQAAALATGHQKKKEVKDKDRFEKQITEELYKIFCDTNSFYYSHTTDLTNSLQRLCSLEKNGTTKDRALWKSVDDRFFWNKDMLQDLIEDGSQLCDPWILPIIQGYVQIEDCKVDTSQYYQSGESNFFEVFNLCILSRRSRFRAGTRYKRRGVNENGDCANYVETEQIIVYQSHEVSFVQVRGSVPVYWSQPGYKYRPPPKIDKGEAETKEAFEKHFNKEIQKYGPVCAVNLIDQSGNEKIIFDAYSNHVLQYDSIFLTYVTFDFHEYCRGMRFENVSVLINAISDVIKEMNYCWRDSQGHICSQNGVFRVNCIDCLDRTNVVQTAIGKSVMEMQFCKLGLITPEGSMPDSIKSTFQLLWANNGDIISKQYAGTNALKGDYTRTGERKFTGIMKDGMNSANRYYLSRFKDSTRQGTIDLMLGNYINEDIFNDHKSAQMDEEELLATAEHVKMLMDDCKKMLISNLEYVLGAWGLIDADPSTGDPSETEMDSIVILTKNSYFVADYDDQVDKITKYQEVLLKDVTLIESGTPESGKLSFSSNKNKFCIRINYKVDGVSGYYHMFRSSNLAFFNNMAVFIKNIDEEVESLKAICEAFVVAIDMSDLPAVQYNQCQSLDRRRSKVVTSSGRFYLDIVGFPQLTRNVSESQLLSLKNVGTKAISNMTQQFSKLNKIGKSFKNPNARNKNTVTIGRQRKDDVSSESSEDEDSTIFQPDDQVGNDKTSNTDSSFASVDQAIEASESLNHSPSMIKLDDKVGDAFLPGVGIVMGKTGAETAEFTRSVLADKDNLFSRQDSSNVDDIQLSSIMQNVFIQKPEIQINSDVFDGKIKSAGGNLVRKYSHSSDEVYESSLAEPDSSAISKFDKRSNSDYDVSALNITQSQSESALKNIIASALPVGNVTRGLVFSPISKLARGVQNLGANLDPRRLATSGQVKHVSEKEMEEHRKLQERWKHCKTRLIAL